jgi:hypothetical protein
MPTETCLFNCETPADCDGSCKPKSPGIARPAVEGKRMPMPNAEPAAPWRMSWAEPLKDTNPKDAIGSMKLPLHLVPSTMTLYAALAFAEGAAKYGAHNWRIAGVRSSVYYSALQRHLAKYWNGEDIDPKTKVPHLASALACIAVLVDASVANKLLDDRPPALPGVPDLIDHDAYAVVQHVRELFADHNPRHYTIEDTQHG